jgi:hypothetical protein
LIKVMPMCEVVQRYMKRSLPADDAAAAAEAAPPVPTVRGQGSVYNEHIHPIFPVLPCPNEEKDMKS